MAAIIGATFVVSIASPVLAQNKTTHTMPVLLTVENSCRLITNPLDFGIPDPKAKSATTTTTITITCTPGIIYTVGIDNGQHWNGRTRRMHGGTTANGQVWYAEYQIYKDPLHLLPWGTGATAALGVLGLPSRTMTLYGVTQIKNLRPAPYRDTVIVQLDF